MSDETTPVIEVHAAATDVVLMNLACTDVVRVHHPDGPREYRGGLHDVITVAADPATLGYDEEPQTYHALLAIHRGLNAWDRAAWIDAGRLVRHGGVALVHHGRTDQYGVERWTALWASKVTGPNAKLDTAMVLARRMPEGRGNDPVRQPEILLESNISRFLLEHALRAAESDLATGP